MITDEQDRAVRDSAIDADTVIALPLACWEPSTGRQFYCYVFAPVDEYGQVVADPRVVSPNGCVRRASLDESLAVDIWGAAARTL